jgi:Zn-dependent alcohol dehydrogenase
MRGVVMHAGIVEDVGSAVTTITPDTRQAIKVLLRP